MQERYGATVPAERAGHRLGSDLAAVRGRCVISGLTPVGSVSVSVTGRVSACTSLSPRFDRGERDQCFAVAGQQARRGGRVQMPPGARAPAPSAAGAPANAASAGEERRAERRALGGSSLRLASWWWAARSAMRGAFARQRAWCANACGRRGTSSALWRASARASAAWASVWPVSLLGRTPCWGRGCRRRRGARSRARPARTGGGCRSGRVRWTGSLAAVSSAGGAMQGEAARAFVRVIERRNSASLSCGESFAAETKNTSPPPSESSSPASPSPPVSLASRNADSWCEVPEEISPRQPSARSS